MAEEKQGMCSKCKEPAEFETVDGRLVSNCCGKPVQGEFYNTGG